MPGSPLYLLDSSVIGKWFVQEEDSDKALEIRDLFIQKKHRVSTISLLRYELGNVLWKHPAKRIESVREDFESLSEVAIPTLDIDDPKVLTRVFETARRLEITFYDASYLTATEESKAVLVTADKRLFGRLLLHNSWNDSHATSDSSPTSSSSIGTCMILRSSWICPREQNEKHQ